MNIKYLDIRRDFVDEELNYLAECFIDCQIATEKIIGSEYSDFIALANLSKELAFLIDLQM